MTQQSGGHQRSNKPTLGRPEQWLRVAVLAVVVGLAVYGAWQGRQDAGSAARPAESSSDEPLPATVPEPAHHDSGSIVASQTIRDQDGRVVFRGDVDVGPTLERIDREERLPFSHDGTVFQNRERRLPKKPASYYHEFVHPTPTVSGPGPQRIIIGRDGEIYYTPDHYRTFKRLEK